MSDPSRPPIDRPPTGPPPGAGTLVFGVAGGIASGKSTVARRLAGEGGLVLDADRLAREELESEAGRARLLERFGAEALDADGQPDRAWIAARVFADDDARRWLEGWIHPAVRGRMCAALEVARAARTPRVVLDVPLLFENDAQHDLVAACDGLVFVHASEEVREARARRARAWPAGELARREATQAPLAEKRARADHVIDNDGDLDQLNAAVQAVLESYGAA